MENYMGNGTNLETRTSFKEMSAIAFYLWCWTILVLAFGFVLGNTLKDDMSVAGVFCQENK